MEASIIKPVGIYYYGNLANHFLEATGRDLLSSSSKSIEVSAKICVLKARLVSPNSQGLATKQMTIVLLNVM